MLAHRVDSAMAAITSARMSFGCGLVNRMRSIPSTASSARRSAAKLFDRRPQVAAVGVHVLAEQRHLADAVGRQEGGLADEIVGMAAVLAPAHDGTMQ